MQFPTLYSRTNTGAVQQWTIFTEGNLYWTEGGQVGGAQTKHDPTECFGKNTGKKNATTDEQQAVAEAQGKWDKKAKTGYFEDVTKIDEMPYIECMRAKKFKDYAKKIQYPVGVQIKFNGVRCMTNSTTKIVGSKHGMFSREGERWISVPHIDKAFAPFFEKYPEAVVDGELFNEDLREKLNELIHLVRQQKPTAADLAESEKVVRYYVYDLYDATVKKDAPYKERAAAIPALLADNPYYVQVETWIANNEAELWEIYNRVIATGHEGVIVRDLTKGYENKKSSAILKVKPEDDEEVELISVQEGNGAWAGKAKTITVKRDNGMIFDVTFKGTMAQAVKFLQEFDTKWKGTRATIKFNGFTGLGCPQYAQLDINNCLRADLLKKKK